MVVCVKTKADDFICTNCSDEKRIDAEEISAPNVFCAQNEENILLIPLGC